MTWFEEVDEKTIELVKSSGNHVVAVPAMDNGIRLDTFDLFDNRTHKFIIRNLPEHDANIAVTVCNNLIDNDTNIDINNFLWLIGK